MSTPPGTTSPETTEQLSLAFWRSFVRQDKPSYLEALTRLQAARGEGGSHFSFEDIAGESAEVGAQPGKLSSTSPLFIQLPGTPSQNVMIYWRNAVPVQLVEIDAEKDCLGCMSGKDSEYFVGCCLPKAGSGILGECSILTHAKPTCMRVLTQGKAWAIKLRPATETSRPRVLSHAILRHGDVPSEFFDRGLALALTDIRVPAAVWKDVIDAYPGRSVIFSWLVDDSPEFPIRRVVVDTEERVVVEDASSSAAEEEKSEDVPRSIRAATEDPWIGDESPSVVDKGTSFARNWQDAFDEDKSKAASSTTAGTQNLGSIAANLLKVKTHLTSLETELRDGHQFLRGRFGVVKQYVDKMGDDLMDRLSLLRNSSRPQMSSSTASKVSLSSLTAKQRSDFVAEVVNAMDPQELAELVAPVLSSMSPAAVSTLRVLSLELRIADLERELSSDDGVVSQLTQQVQQLEKRRDVNSVERGGVVFKDQKDFEALLCTVSDPEFYKYMLDIVSMLTLSQEPFDTYEKGIKAEADAIKANYTDVNASRVKISFQMTFPEVVLVKSTAKGAQGHGGVKWGPLFASTAIFEDDYRSGTHGRLRTEVETVYTLTQAAIDHDYPLTEKRTINGILTDQLRLTYNQTVGWLDCLLPFYKTCKKGGLSDSDAWDRVEVFAREFFMDVHSFRIVSSKRNVADMCWGAMNIDERSSLSFLKSLPF